MALIQNPLIVDGKGWGSIGMLEKAGDEFPEHTHPDETTNHITLFAQGTVRLLGKYAGKLVVAPRVIVWTAGEPHGWVAETDNVYWVNLLKRRVE